MKPVPFKYTADEAGRRGEEIYSRAIRSQVEPSEHGRIVAIDIETEEFVVADTVLDAADQLRQQLPDAQVWLVRVGFPALHRIGRRFRA